jgi:hypothetical protein
MCLTRQVMTRLVAILVTLFLVAIPAKADVALWPRPVPGWTVIQIYGVIKQDDLATFVRYTENVDPAATLVIVTGPGGVLSAGIGMGLRVRTKKLIVGVMGKCSSSCALIWIGGETGRKFFYHAPRLATSLCFHQASYIKRETDYILPRRIPSAPGNALVSEYLTKLGYNQDMIAWATAADPQNIRCLAL